MLWASGGVGGAFHVIYARLASPELRRTPQRPVVEQLLREHPYSLFVFSNDAQKQWHFLNVKYDDRIEKRRLFRRIAIGPFERLRTATERIKMLDLEEIGPDLFGLSPLAIQQRHDEAFDVEKVQRDFFRTLQTIYEENIVPDILKGLKDETKAREAGLILLNRLIFLYFIQKKGWLREKRAGKDEVRTAEFLFRAFKEHHGEATARTYYTQFLLPLFDALATPKKERNGDRFEPFRGIPFLNGGLFEPDVLATRDAGLRLTNAAFARLFDELLERFNFTVTEDTPLDIEVAVDPEMLGKIFEELVTGRHESGAYYTPRPVVSFMCKEALKGYLQGSQGSGGVSPLESNASTNVGRDAPPPLADPISRFVEEHDASGLTHPELILDKLRAVKVCDPACGSGAYLVGMLQELMALRHALFAAHEVDARTDYERKLDIVQNNLYGVDIDPIAVNIARLRLWLTLCVEYEVKDNGDPPPLPNLDFKIERADSILAPSVVHGEELHDEQIRQFAELKARFLKEPYNKAPLRRRIDEMRSALALWIVHDQAQAAASDFDWRVDFAEVVSAGGNPGFDVILANPPYVHMGIIKGKKPQLTSLYPVVFSGRADLYTYFFARGFELLRQRGLLVFICSSTWTKTAAAEKLRVWLRDRSTVHRYLDFGDLSVFENVTTYPAIIIVEKCKPSKDHAIRANQVRTMLASELEEELHAPGILVPQRELEDGGWRFEDRRIARLRQKIKDTGVPLKDYCGSPLYGIKTGLNEAFVIDQRTRDALIAADPKCAEILKPYLEGKDLKPWRAQWRGLWLIYTYHGIDISRYPAIRDWLKTYKKSLGKRATAHLHPWYELQQPQFEYSKAMEKPKIMYPDIANRPKLVYDDKGLFFGTTVFFIPKDDRYLHGVLMSSVIWFMIREICPALREGLWRYRLKTQYMEILPIVQPSAKDRKKIASLAEALSQGSGGVPPPQTNAPQKTWGGTPHLPSITSVLRWKRS